MMKTEITSILDDEDENDNDNDNGDDGGDKITCEVSRLLRDLTRGDLHASWS